MEFVWLFAVLLYSVFRLVSPERVTRPVLTEHINFLSDSGNTNSNTSGNSSDQTLVLYVPEVEEIRISPIIARKGYLNILEHKTNGWKKRWVVSTLLRMAKCHDILYVVFDSAVFDCVILYMLNMISLLK